MDKKRLASHSGKYNVRANIPPDEQFKKDIQAVKQKAEQGFISALAKFHYRRLEQQKIKLQLRDKTKACRIGSLNEKGLSTEIQKQIANGGHCKTVNSSSQFRATAQQSQIKNVKSTGNCKQ